MKIDIDFGWRMLRMGFILAREGPFSRDAILMAERGVASCGATVERREAPPPYVIGGARAVATARGGPRHGPQGARRGTRRLPALHVPRVRGSRKKGKGRARAPEQQRTRAA